MPLRELENEIREAIIELKIENKVKAFSGEKKNNILLKLKSIFVRGDPRVWWLSLKYKPTSYVFEEQLAYKKINYFFNENDDVWFVAEDDVYDEPLLYKTKVSFVIDIIGGCTGFEYNIISENCEKYLCENDHGEFLYIDIHENPLR
jgi:hypothetical protein